MNKVCRFRRRLDAEFSVCIPFFSIDPAYRGWSSSAVFVDDVRRMRDLVWRGRCPGQRALALGSEYVKAGRQSQLLYGVGDSGIPADIGIGHVVAPHAPSTEGSRELLFWIDAFHVVELSEFDERDGSLFEARGSCRRYILDALCRYSRARNLPPLRALPPHLADDVAAQSIARDVVSLEVGDE